MSSSTTPAVDVNEAFAAERGRQADAVRAHRADLDSRLANGTLVAVGGDRYRVNEPGNWDNGEILTMRGGMLVPQHGLDTTRGQAALYTAQPAWHALGNVIPGGTADIDTVLRLGGIDYTVHRRPVLYRDTPDGPAKVLDGQYVTVRDDTSAGLGVVGSRYTVMQNRTVFEFLQDLVDQYDITWESAGALREGRKVFVSLRLPHTITIDATGINDQILPFIVAVNSHDGSSLFQVVATPWRPVCGNTERFALRDAHTRWGIRHTRNAHERVDEARRTLRLSIDYYQQFAAEEEALARTALALDEFRKVIDDLWAPPAVGASDRAKANHAVRTARLVEGFTSNAESLGRTAYAAERAITEYADWGKNIRPTGSLRGNSLAARATLALEGTEDELKATAHRRLLTLVRR
ncbi:phage/plasmid-like protein (TIGR03299 family) [Allocatelliglobosispora scoriae]|uniref:Phage/plasmid-like protein (TIGR03299 family) n=1 Tax=Allocatelliglobosispora scoriae TaxID=643052 RepID=A0A841C624_9ACTN|nr:DUF932 domain-containing protein [Allocatelliglobosispora scoriae]MBB5874593.1 phage/plasmid-like protein (TIGR03299 family) [Allocatelliglobosispora scoriae]